ncbi:hypothetical protein NP92_14510 [Anoxybacillus gonensis]|uniref:Uncharacterized protein n=1 Tax=Anoxybacillus gonensis TaxID=198467 RepID=A0AAW7THV3_9BACL|nr:hypothetical protein [Anoxybacillus gonensis]KGP59364.1 hypothetical protein NP92_14510 [Anoxybacillus gonensis]MDO0878789.1 hypothetical protein [Anoxybacillus gonensis]
MHRVSLDYALEFGAACYDAGMVEVIREIAVQELATGGATILQSRFTNQLLKIVEEKYHKLENTLNRHERQMLKEFEEAFQEASAADAHDHYIAGFISGYRYLKNYITFHTDFKGAYDNE